jgi:VIT1/CCC1 family predicted Fe2+/Mn2+ transporter
VLELAESFEARGVERELAVEVARQLSADPKQALETHSQVELGVNPSQLPSPWVAALSSFCFFALGAILPLATYLGGVKSLLPALAVAGVSLFVAGVVTARFTGRSAWYGGLRQLALGALAAAVTYLVGRLIGARIS